LLKENIPGKVQYWVTLDPELMEPDGEMQALMPDGCRGQNKKALLTLWS
jgi:hypothetical protein